MDYRSWKVLNKEKASVVLPMLSLSHSSGILLGYLHSTYSFSVGYVPCCLCSISGQTSCSFSWHHPVISHPCFSMSACPCNCFYQLGMTVPSLSPPLTVATLPHHRKSWISAECLLHCACDHEKRGQGIYRGWLSHDKTPKVLYELWNANTARCMQCHDKPLMQITMILRSVLK